MESSTEQDWSHSHRFDEGNPLAEKNIFWVVILTATMMVIEIGAGWWYHSLALLADGWHMSSHAVALGLSLLAYISARRLGHDPRFSFGTWKIEVLAGYTSAVLLSMVAAFMLFESVVRLLRPEVINYDPAIVVAIVGLGINLLSAFLLRGHHGHDHDHDQPHNHDHDVNLRSAYLHVLADAATSLLAIVALFGGKLYGAAWLDPAMGIVGGVLVGSWVVGLIRDSSKVLLDAENDAPVTDNIRRDFAKQWPAATLCDLHVWRVGKAKYAAILSIAGDGNLTPDRVKQALANHDELAHITVEINPSRT